MIADVTVIIPTVHGREHQLAEALESIAAQTVQPKETIILSTPWVGNSWVAGARRNRLIEMSETTWLAPLDDDDVLLPHHLEVLLAGALDFPDALVIHSLGEGMPTPSADYEHLRRGNFIPVTALVDRRAAIQAGGFADRPCDRWQFEDHALWVRILDTFGPNVFRHVPATTWVHRPQSVGLSNTPGHLEPPVGPGLRK